MFRSKMVVAAAILVAGVLTGASAQQRGTFTDSRDNKTYRMVTIGNQIWMAENLSFNADGSWCNGNDANNCNGYGRHYDWATAMGLESSCNRNRCASQVQTQHRGICPAGWHLPSRDEWQTLIDFVGSNGGTKLKTSRGWQRWTTPIPTGTDNFGFSAMPAGFFWDGNVRSVGMNTTWWSATEEDGWTTHTSVVGYGTQDVNMNASGKDHGYSVRCIRD